MSWNNGRAATAQPKAVSMSRSYKPGKSRARKKKGKPVSNATRVNRVRKFSRVRVDKKRRGPATKAAQRTENAPPLPDWSPAVDISEADREYLIETDLPGMKKEDLQIAVKNGIVFVLGERKTEMEDSKRSYRRVERAHGLFRRGFLVPENADATRISAELSDGVLRLHLPKFPGANGRPLEVAIQ